MHVHGHCSACYMGMYYPASVTLLHFSEVLTIVVIHIVWFHSNKFFAPKESSCTGHFGGCFYFSLNINEFVDEMKKIVYIER